MMKLYSHTQRAGRWLWIPAMACLFLVGLAVWTRIWWVLGSLAVIAGLAWLFSSLTVEVADSSRLAKVLGTVAAVSGVRSARRR